MRTSPLLALKKWWLFAKTKTVTLNSFQIFYWVKKHFCSHSLEMQQNLVENYRFGAQKIRSLPPQQPKILAVTKAKKERSARVETAAFALENSGLLDLVLVYNSVIGWQ